MTELSNNGNKNDHPEIENLKLEIVRLEQRISLEQRNTK